MPSSNQSLPPPVTGATPYAKATPLNKVVYAAACIIAATACVFAERYGFALTCAALLYLAAFLYLGDAFVMWASKPRNKRPAPVAGNDLRTKLNNAGFEDGMCS